MLGFAVVEFFRIFFAWKGNLTENPGRTISDILKTFRQISLYFSVFDPGSMILSMILMVPSVMAVVFYLIWQVRISRNIYFFLVFEFATIYLADLHSPTRGHLVRGDLNHARPPPHFLPHLNRHLLHHLNKVKSWLSPTLPQNSNISRPTANGCIIFI